MKPHTHPHRGRATLWMAALATLAVAVAMTVAGAASGQAPPAAHPAELAYEPSPIPDRVILTPSGDPAVEQSVTWRTHPGVQAAMGQIALDEPGPAFEPKARTTPAESSDAVLAAVGVPATFHTVRFTDLEPDTAYLYRVGDGTNWSEWFAFSTAAATPEPFSFIYYGDAQNDIREHVSRVFRRAFSDRPDARLIVHAGDLVNASARDAEWGEWFTAAGWINGMINSIATPGNHEYSGTVLAPHWKPQFAWPDNGPKGATAAHTALDGTVYYVDYQGVRFVSLNSNRGAVVGAVAQQEFLDIQAQWLRGVLADNPNRWTVVTFHHPVWSNSVGRNNPEIRATWMPVFEEFGVDLVLQGHDHSYGRGRRAADPTAIPGTFRDGPVYVVSVSGPKMYDTSPDNWHQHGGELHRQHEDTQLYQLVDVDGDTLRYEARAADGAPYDGFVITKDADGHKTITESGPGA